MYTLQSFTFIVVFFREILDWATILFIKLELNCALASKKKSIPDWDLFITQMEPKWTKWYAMTSHVIAYRSLELLFGTHTFHFNCFFEDFNCVFTQIRCLSRVLRSNALLKSRMILSVCIFLSRDVESKYLSHKTLLDSASMLAVIENVVFLWDRCFTVLLTMTFLRS